MESIPHWKKSICYACQSDIGMRRANNQDSYGVRVANSAEQWLSRGHLFIVADGMGAHVAGEVASRMTVDTVTQSYLRRTKESPAKALEHAVLDAHDRIRERSKREDAYRDMGTTCDAFALTPQGLIIAHVGDSRVYRIRANRIEQMTFDHSLVWEICTAHGLPVNSPPYHIPKNQITRSIGPTNNLQVDIEGPHRILHNDIFLACSDGLTGKVQDNEIGEIVTIMPPENAAETLINIANLRGGPDNTTIIIVKATHDNKVDEEVDECMRLPAISINLFYITIALTAILLIVSMFGLIIVGAIAGLSALGTAIASFVTAQKYLFAISYFANTETFGKAPYANANCQPEENFAAALEKMLTEAKQAVEEKAIKINTKETDYAEQKANNAKQNKNHAETIKNYAIAINSLMRELKKVRSSESGTRN
ncbi:MAG: protein phosphatase 2C domain-containing protein [Planctomycetaceae bacterium]|jgi:protein phosphatase|nr:protein phosphatase 2C domain-containing protein [Planctomycetaceae bacterium]